MVNKPVVNKPVINKMVLASLRHRPVRAVLSVLAVAIEVVMIISVIGLVTGLLEEAARRQRGIGADIIVQPPGGSMLLGMSSAPMPAKIADRLRQDPSVAAVTPVFLQSFGGLTVAYGIDLESFSAVTGGFQMMEGRLISSGLELTVDDIYADMNNLRVGSRQELFSREFELVGIVQRGKGARLFMPLATMQKLLGSPGRASIFYVRLADPEQTAAVLARFKNLLPGYTIRSMEEYTSLLTAGNLPGLKPFQRVMIGIAIIIGFLVVFLAMYTTVLERTREIGILKALGASQAYVVKLILRETIVVAAVGVAVGIAASLLLRHTVLDAYPSLSILITPAWVLRASLIAVGGALLGSAYPALRAARQDALAALAYE